jgi:hypothetical protein
MKNMNWTKISSDNLPIEGKKVDIQIGLKILYGYVLEMDNSVNYHFQNIKTGTVVDGFAVDEWRYSI